MICLTEIDGAKSKAEAKAIFAGLDAWAFDTTRAISFHLLVDNTEFSLLSGHENTYVAKRVKEFEEQYVYKLTCHYIHNYICDRVSCDLIC